jgi:hypothetical protein
MNDTTPGTGRKPLAINLDPVSYGSFAEIGAGQAVARWFFEVGGAAGPWPRRSQEHHSLGPPHPRRRAVVGSCG